MDRKPCGHMNLGKRIELRLAEIGKTRAYLFEQVPGLSSPTLSLAISRDNKRCKWEVQIAEALGVRLAWLKTGLLPKLVYPECDDRAFSQWIADLILDGQPVQAVMRIVENMSGKERRDLRYFMERLEES